jgi:hypothetical protein
VTINVSNDKPLSVGTEPKPRPQNQERDRPGRPTEGQAEGTSSAALDVDRAAHLYHAETAGETGAEAIRDPLQARTAALHLKAMMAENPALARAAMGRVNGQHAAAALGQVPS